MQIRIRHPRAGTSLRVWYTKSILMGKRALITKARDFYARFERPLSSLSLVGGFVFDALTLRRVDLFWDNVWVVAHLTIVTVCAVWLNLLAGAEGEEADPERLQFWLVNIMQFFFGGILSTYLVFYFRSGTFAASWPFLLMLALAFAANESLKRRFARLTFQITLLFLAFYAFAIYLLPILTHEIGVRTFLLSGIVSVAAISLVLLVVALFSRGRFAGTIGLRIFAAIFSVLVAVNLLYFFKLIPPLPLSLKDADVYHSLSVNAPAIIRLRTKRRMAVFSHRRKQSILFGAMAFGPIPPCSRRRRLIPTSSMSGSITMNRRAPG